MFTVLPTEFHVSFSLFLRV